MGIIVAIKVRLSLAKVQAMRAERALQAGNALQAARAYVAARKLLDGRGGPCNLTMPEIAELTDRYAELAHRCREVA